MAAKIHKIDNMQMSPNIRICIVILTLLRALFPSVGIAEACGDKPVLTIAPHHKSGVFFEIRKNGQPVSYILGTVHIASPEIARAANAAFQKLAKVHAAGFEIVQSQDELADEAVKYMTNPQGTVFDLRLHLGKARFTKLMTLLKATCFGNRPETLAHIKPWAIAVMLEMLDQPAGAVLDEKLKDTALNIGKPVFGLEQPSEQFGIFRDMAEPLQWRMLIEALDNHEKIQRLIKATLTAYIQHDAERLAALEEDEMACGDDPELDRFLLQHVLLDRNRVMEARLLPKLKDGVLVAVGIMHLMGPEGLLHRLENDGYSVMPLP